jgi:hypothetical protein
MGKKIKKLIPKEIKPALPFVAAYFGGPMLASKFAMNPAFSKALTASLASKIQGDDTKTAIRSGIFAAAPDVISGGLQKAGTALTPQTTQALKESLKFTGGVGPSAVPVSQQIGSALGSAGQTLASTGFTPGGAISFKDAAKVIGAQTAAEAGARAVDLNEKALRDYEAQLREQGIMDSAERRNKIFGYFSNAGYDPTEVNSFLDKYGYKKGGRVEKTDLKGFGEKYIEFMKEREKAAYGGRIGFDKGGRSRDPRTAVLISSLLEKGMNLEDALNIVDEEYPEEFDSSGLMSGLEGIMSGYQAATGQSLMSPKPQPTRFGLANGGIMNLGGREMDMRGGGFIPIGAKERADDVPARLSKNEFVMTADAVRAAGGGSINKGAKRMYDLMNKLEAKA